MSERRTTSLPRAHEWSNMTITAAVRKTGARTGHHLLLRRECRVGLERKVANRSREGKVAWWRKQVNISFPRRTASIFASKVS